MAEQIKMPQLSDTMSDGKILEWRVAEGQEVHRGDILAEVETDKANLEIECFYNGTLLQINTPAGETADVGQVIAVIGQPGEAVNGNDSPPAQASSQEPSPGASPVSPEQQPAPVQSSKEQPKYSMPQQSPAEEAPESHSNEERPKASPLARKLAEQKNIDLSQVKGTGPQGRIVKRDLDNISSQESPASSPSTPEPERKEEEQPASTPTRSEVPQAASGGSLTELSKMRATIAKRMQQSVQESPHFYLTTTVRMDEVVKLRGILKQRKEFEGISFNHFIIKAAAKALRAVPAVNCAMKEGKLYTPPAVNIGIITALEDGLLIPVVKDADSLSLKDITFEAKAAVARARAGRPSAADLSGGTFSISNMGMFDVESFTAIINPGQGGILAVSSIKDEPVVEHGAIVPAKLMRVTLSVDHRIIDGVTAGNFAKELKNLLETPALLLI